AGRAAPGDAILKSGGKQCVSGLLRACLPWGPCGISGLCNSSSFLLLLPGCELTASTKSYTFQVDEDDDSDHVLALSVVCLTDGAKDECNVVEVVGRNHKNQEIAVPVANLKLSCQPLLSLDNFKLQPPVTFRLAAGSGPVHLAGWHQICKGSRLGNGLGGARDVFQHVCQPGSPWEPHLVLPSTCAQCWFPRALPWSVTHLSVCPSAQGRCFL
uniref:Nucleoplasmin core domain-containing protein n=1 Tax=Pavo cristatus TaxID=9049 RepID=A0A8C9GB06_PAVCR